MGLWVSEATMAVLFCCDLNRILTLLTPTHIITVGKNKKEAVKVYGKDQVKSWRRAFDDPPPPMEDDHEFHPARDPRYRNVRGQLHDLSGRCP